MLTMATIFFTALLILVVFDPQDGPTPAWVLRLAEAWKGEQR